MTDLNLQSIDDENQDSGFEMLDDDFHSVSGAVEALGYIRPNAKEAVPALIETLQDGNAFVRYHSAESLGEIGGRYRTCKNQS